MYRLQVALHEFFIIPVIGRSDVRVRVRNFNRKPSRLITTKFIQIHVAGSLRSMFHRRDNFQEFRVNHVLFAKLGFGRH